MRKIHMGVADDEEKIHQSFDYFVSSRKEYGIEIKHFYSTCDLKDYLYENPYSLDMLFLDVIFVGGESGVEALPKIREYAPVLPITLLTANDDLKLYEDIQPLYRFDYFEKPISTTSFILHMKSVLQRKEDYEKLTEDIKDYTEYVNYVEQDKQDLELRFEKISDIKIPKSFKDLISMVFPDIDFLPQALLELLGIQIDERVFRVLKSVDWKLPPSQGMRVQRFHAMKKRDVWEYRFSQSGRVLVEYRKNEKPLIILVDFNHKNW